MHLTDLVGLASVVEDALGGGGLTGVHGAMIPMLRYFSRGDLAAIGADDEGRGAATDAADGVARATDCGNEGIGGEVSRVLWYARAKIDKITRFVGERSAAREVGGGDAPMGLEWGKRHAPRSAEP